MAKNYIDNLSEEVKKGQLEKAEQGIFCGPAPIGYSNVARADGKRIIDVDPEYAPSVIRMFELYATGSYTLKDLKQHVIEEGVISRRNATIGTSNIHHTLRNPLYKGEFQWRGSWYQGSHPALVSVGLWDRVQQALDGKGTTHPAVQRHQFAFNGVLYCGVCADDFDLRRLLVGEIQKGKYVYYHCSHCARAGRKPPFVKEETLSTMFSKELRQLQLDGRVLEWLKTGLRSSRADEQRFHQEAVGRVSKQLASLQRKLDLLYDDRLDERITVDRYEEKSNGLREEMAHARAELGRFQAADRTYTEEGIALLELAGKAVGLWESQPPPEKRALLDFLCLNSEFRNGAVHVEWRKPFEGLAEIIAEIGKMGTGFDESTDAHPIWLGKKDSNLRMLESEPSALPDLAIPQRTRAAYPRL